MKLKKQKKSKRMGSRTHGRSAKLNKGKGSRGGKGMSGSGKRADQKKTKVINKYGKKYFGKQGATSKRTAKKRTKVINLNAIVKRFQPGEKEIDLSDYKILGEGEIKGKFIIKARAASKSAIDKVKKEGGSIIVEEKSE
jgi:large subunit ribosomal protein L15